MQKRISRLLMTDFFCWIPVCTMASLRIAGVSLSPDAYIASAGCLLPINSEMNPLLTHRSLVSACHVHENASQTTCLPLVHVMLMTPQRLMTQESREIPIPTVSDRPSELVQRMHAVPKKRGVVTANTLVWV